MTEAEWLACTDAEAIRAFLSSRGGMSERKFRLLNCAFSRLMWRHFTDARATQAVETAERFADGVATPEEMAGAFDALYRCGHVSLVLTDGEFALLPSGERFDHWSIWCAWSVTWCRTQSMRRARAAVCACAPAVRSIGR